MNEEYNTLDNTIDKPLLITVKEACKIMNMGRNTLLKLVKVKSFPAIILSGKILIDRNQLPI